MLSKYLSFVRVRIFALAYATCFSILTFAIILFVLPTAGSRHVTSLAVIAVVSLIVGLAACVALIAPKTQSCSRNGRGIKMYVGIELLCSIASLPLLATAILLEAQLTNVRIGRTEQGRNPNGIASDLRTGRTLSALLLILSCSTALVVTTYACLIAGLAVYTHKRTRRTDVWFSDAASQVQVFVFPHALRFLRYERGEAPDADLESARRSRRIGVENLNLEITPTLRMLLHQIYSREQSRHTVAPDCSCGEKLPWVARQPDEYRALGRVYARVWAIVAEREAQERAQALGGSAGRQRSWSVPVPTLRLPTERERRRTMFLVAFDAARFEH